MGVAYLASIARLYVELCGLIQDGVRQTIELTELRDSSRQLLLSISNDIPTIILYYVVANSLGQYCIIVESID